MSDSLRSGMCCAGRCATVVLLSFAGVRGLSEREGGDRNADWPVNMGDATGRRYSPLEQINRGNVADLEVAWVYHTGDAGPGTNIECTPIVIDRLMYLTTADGKVVSLDAATGERRWEYDAFEKPKPNVYPDRAHGPRGLNRGVAYWRDGDGPAYIFMGTMDGYLIKLDATAGKPAAGFGQDGLLDLHVGIERDISKVYYGVTSAPLVFEDLVIVGFANGEGGVGEAPGDIRAFSARTGEELWRFHTIPRPGAFGNETWAEGAWKDRGGANAWGGLTLDAARGIVFAGTGSAGADYLGSDRHGENLFANCVLALNARTGERIWHFQTVRHDLWDLDVPTPPVLVRLRSEGVERDAVAQVSKTGFVYVLDRETGKPLFPVEERPVRPSDIPGEAAWPTQVFPLAPPPFVLQHFGPDTVTDISPEARAYVLEQLKHLRAGSIFNPPSAEGSVYTPGLHGGATWAGASFDPETGVLYVAGNNVPWVATFTEPPDRGLKLEKFEDHEGYPAIRPPWGTLTAVDLNKGELVWQATLGEFPELTARGIAPTGTENFGGNIVTAGGLIFVAGTMDEMFRAFDKTSGKVLWEYKLNAAGYAQPCTYMVDGRQYVVIAAGGGGKLGTKTGDEFVAFTLPERKLSERAGASSARKVVFLAGAKSHGPGDHEYEHALRYLKECLGRAENVGEFRSEIYLNGWPDDESVLDDASAVVIYSDGSDHDEKAHPFLTGDRLAVLDRLMARGAGLVAIHYSVFVPYQKAGDRFMRWIGGYFDYENGPEGKWFSMIENREFRVRPACEHPITRGLAPFDVREEFYFRMRLSDRAAGWKPVLTFGEDGDLQSVVGWAIERGDGGRGFGFTGGHYYENFRTEHYTKLLLNAIVWAAGGEVPEGGVHVEPPETIRALIVTGHNHPAHDWRATTAALQEVLQRDRRFAVSVVEDPEFLANPRLAEYDLIVQNYVNWERPAPSAAAQQGLLEFVKGGKGLAVIHFANGAFRDWPGYGELVRRVWVDGKSGHDAYGAFRVVPCGDHEIVDGIEAYETTDELYFHQQGDAPIEVIATARSAVTQQDEPMAFAYDVGEGRVFQTVLGHDAAAIRNDGTAELLRRGCAWSARHAPAFEEHEYVS